MSCDWNWPHCNAEDEHEPFYGECPHCCRCEFRDDDDWFEHVSNCQYEQSLDEEE